MKKFSEPWLIVLLLLGSAVMIEGLHMVEHGHCRRESTSESDSLFIGNGPNESSTEGT